MTITIVGGGNPSGPTFPVQRSVRLRSSASAYFNRTPASTTNRRTFTWSGWVKRGALADGVLITASNGTQYVYFAYSTNALTLQINTGTNYIYTTTAVLRDPSAWYHVVLAVDTTQALDANRVQIYINGAAQARSAGGVPQNTDTQVNVSAVPSWMGSNGGVNTFLDGYLTEVNFIDGQALTPASFGAYNSYGVWSPAKYSGSYGTNGFYLNFQDNSGATATTIGKDSSGNGNNWTPNNISVTAGVTYDSMLDVPTLTSNTNANFPVLNVIAGLGNGTYSDGNLGYLNGVGATWKSGVASMGVTSGKYYFEYTITARSASSNFYLGVAGSTYTGFASYLGRTSDSWAFQWNGASSVKTNNDVSTTVSTAGSISVNDVIQVAIDLNTGSIWWGRNNTWVQGDPSAGTGASYTNLTGTILPGFAVYSNGGDKIAANFGQRPFSYTPPTGFKSLNTFNLPTPTIPNGAAQFATVLRSGNGSNTVVSGLLTAPDFVWIKSRSAVEDHILVDSVRGVNQTLKSNSTSAEVAYLSVTAFNSDGYNVNVNMNASGRTYVDWCWKANGTPAVTNTSGSIPSTISANTTSGFSIVTYTGTGSNATVGHGLGVAPRMIMVKYRNVLTSNDWNVYHASLGATQRLYLNLTNAAQTSSLPWNNTTPTSTVFSIGTGSDVNNSATNYVAYCFAEIAGYSKFGSYTGNGSADGPFVYLGFRPRWLLIKSSSMAGTRWELFDTSRSPINPSNQRLSPNESAAEVSGYNSPDLLSNGFKLRGASGYTNDTGVTYTYAAFAENPFNYSLAR
jgi:hypothetical protein